MPKPNVVCDNCKNKFYKKPSQIARSKRNFCSLDCSAQGQRNGKILKCFLCNKNTYKQGKDLKRNQSGRFFCSKECSLKWRNSEYVGSKHPNWVSGASSYRERLKKNNEIPQICTLCKEKDKRVLVVHHVDKNRRNNHSSNLVWLCNNCHFLVHNYKRESQGLSKMLS